MEASNETHTVCACTHLTYFAVLMDVNGVQVRASTFSASKQRRFQLPLSHEIALVALTYAGCVVSIVCLLCSLVAFQCLRSSAFSERTTIHKNLSFSLLAAQLVFVAGIWQTSDRVRTAPARTREYWCF